MVSRLIIPCFRPGDPMRTRRILLVAGILGLAWSFTASGAPFLIIDGWGLPVHKPHQVASCPGGTGEGKLVKSWTNGNKMLKGYCSDGVAVDDWVIWHENGQKQWQVEFDAGKPDGKYKAWYDNGELQAYGWFDQGMKVDSWYFYYSDGTSREKGEYIADEAVGCHKAWHSNGVRSAKGAYVDGEKVGRWFYWDKQGKRRKEVYGGSYDQGRCWWPLI
jgi:antitoxin component YwqK of YwqJK toxin-antitoxin module